MLFQPDLIGLSTTEDMYELGLLFLDTIKDYMDVLIPIEVNNGLSSVVY